MGAKRFEFTKDPGRIDGHDLARVVWAAAFAAEARLHIMTADPVELTPATANECAAVADACVRLLAEVELP